MNNRKDTAFTVELLGLFIMLIVVITTVAGVFVMSRAHSLQAKQLNEAVILAQSTAEVSSAAPDDEALADMLHDLGNNTGHAVISRESSETAGSWNAFYAGMNGAAPADGESYIICVTRTYPDGTSEERADRGTYAVDTIEVYAAGGRDPGDIGSLQPTDLSGPVYTLTAGTYFGNNHFEGEGERP